MTPPCGRTRSLGGSPPADAVAASTVVPLVRVPRTLPKILAPAEVDALLGALRTQRDRAMVLAMVLGGLRRCEVLGLRLADVRWPSGRCSSPRARAATSGWCRSRTRSSPRSATTCVDERPADCPTDRVFVTLKGPSSRTGAQLDGVDEIMRAARDRAGLERATCHQLRHTCLTRLREAGMALEAVQAQAGHVSIESTRIYLHLTNDWLADEYHQAAELIDAHAAELLALEAVAQ